MLASLWEQTEKMMEKYTYKMSKDLGSENMKNLSAKKSEGTLKLLENAFYA